MKKTNKVNDYFHTHIGYNYRMPNAQALLALKSLKDYPKESKRRAVMESLYNNCFEYGRLPKRDAVWVYDYIGKPIKAVIMNGKIIKVTTRPFFKPLSSFPMYGGKCQSPKAQYYSERGNYIKI